MITDLPIVDERFSVEMYSRILAQFVLPTEVDRILWLDADIVVLKDLYPFYNMDFKGKGMIVCANIDSTSVEERKYKLGLDENNTYFNSGVLLINVEKLRRETTKDEIYAVITKMKEFLLYPDQDILNILYKNDILVVDHEIYNYQLNCEKTIPSTKLNNIVVLHYTGKAKPWKLRNIVSSSMPYWSIVKKQGNWATYILAKCVYTVKWVLKKNK